ncbi:MAG TPA: rRNA maturation RNase YbeY [Povalibacter sp.]|uniref:rRNA maturation RNase YbeY n=1 Tax=Povalibacter sp. TaxID=1962978 RepID=UPI002C014388|nr:rRNA maturation RNase YbeY [Povalibacter sp.]HMN45971.1 rRNA maturation RNase YbeY [Povalibacter sp.]
MPRSVREHSKSRKRGAGGNDVELEVPVQFAASRKGVPHPGAMRRWAVAAFIGGLPGAKTIPGAERISIVIRIVGAAESRRLNVAWRGKDKPTNVLSFPSGLASSQQPAASGPAPLGDLVICAPVVAREAREQGKTPPAHWAHMVIHGTLHLLGYDHEIDRDAELMEAREMNLLATFGYPNPYA